jgi:hypothetical protein
VSTRRFTDTHASKPITEPGLLPFT